MKIKMNFDDHSSYYRSLGMCFDFVSDIKYATELTREQALDIMDYDDWYLQMYDAKSLEIVK